MRKQEVSRSITTGEACWVSSWASVSLPNQLILERSERVQVCRRFLKYPAEALITNAPWRVTSTADGNELPSSASLQDHRRSEGCGKHIRRKTQEARLVQREPKGIPRKIHSVQ